MCARPFVIPLRAGCCFDSFACTQSAPKPPPPHYRLTVAVPASRYQAPPAQPQGSCTMHAQIQNEGGPGRGGVGELILNYRPAGRADVLSATSHQAVPPLD